MDQQLLAILISLLPFYRIDLPIEPLPESLVYSVYSNGSESYRREISSKDVVYGELVALLEEERAGWKYDLDTHAPKILFTGRGITINCSGSSLIINFQDGPKKWAQVSKSGIKRACPKVNLALEGRSHGITR